jgi:hypothetical protein
MPSEALIEQEPDGHTPSVVYLVDMMLELPVVASLTVAVRVKVAVYATGLGFAITFVVTGPRASPVPTHTPPEQESPMLQALLSLQGVPSGAFGFEHVPVDALQVPAR